MVHIFNEEEEKMEQIHYKKLDYQRNSQQIYKRQRTMEYTKFLEKLEADRTKGAEKRALRRAALAKK